MDSVRFFKDRSRAQLKQRRAAGDTQLGLQQVQHQIAVAGGYRSWRALLDADEPDRQLAVVMTLEPDLCINGFGPGHYGGDLEERRANFVRWRTELRAHAERVEVVREWLMQNVEKRSTINSDAGSYGLKHMAEKDLNDYISNGELIAAAIIAGYSYRRGADNSPNAAFGMSSRSITGVRSRVRS
jgi:hypothetical protein